MFVRFGLSFPAAGHVPGCSFRYGVQRMGVAIGSTQSFLISFQPFTFLSCVFFMALSSCLSFQDGFIEPVSGSQAHPPVGRFSLPLPVYLSPCPVTFPSRSRCGLNSIRSGRIIVMARVLSFFFDVRISETIRCNNRGHSESFFGWRVEFRKDAWAGAHRKGQGTVPGCLEGSASEFVRRTWSGRVSRRFAGCSGEIVP